MHKYLNLKIAKFFWIALLSFGALFFLHLYDYTLLTVFFGRDLARATVIFDQAFFYGPETSGAGNLIGPFYYLLLGIFIKLGASWDGLNLLRIALFFNMIGLCCHFLVKQENIQAGVIFFASLLFFTPFQHILIYDHNGSLCTALLMSLTTLVFFKPDLIKSQKIFALLFCALLSQMHGVSILYGILLIIAWAENKKSFFKDLTLLITILFLISFPYWLNDIFAYRFSFLNYLYIPEKAHGSFFSIFNLFDGIKYLFLAKSELFKNFYTFFFEKNEFSIFLLVFGFLKCIRSGFQKNFKEKIVILHSLACLLIAFIYAEETRYYVVFFLAPCLYGALALAQWIEIGWAKFINVKTIHLIQWVSLVVMVALTLSWNASVDRFIRIESPHLSYAFRRTFCHFIVQQGLDSENLRRHIYLVNLETETTLFDSYGLSQCGGQFQGDKKNRNFIIVNQMKNFENSLPSEIKTALLNSSVFLEKVFNYEKIDVYEIIKKDLYQKTYLPNEVSNVGYSYIDNDEVIGVINVKKEMPDYVLIGEYQWNFCRESIEKNCDVRALLLQHESDHSRLKFVLNGTPLSVPYMLYKTSNAQLWEDVGLNLSCGSQLKSYPLFSFVGETWEFQHRSFLAPLSVDIKNPCPETSRLTAEVTVKKMTIYDGSKPFPYDGISQEKINGFMNKLNQSSFQFEQDIRVKL